MAVKNKEVKETKEQKEANVKRKNEEIMLSANVLVKVIESLQELPQSKRIPVFKAAFVILGGKDDQDRGYF